MHFSGFVDPAKIKDFEEHRNEYAQAGKTQEFHDAIKEIDEYINDLKVTYIYIFSLQTLYMSFNFGILSKIYQ